VVPDLNLPLLGLGHPDPGDLKIALSRGSRGTFLQTYFPAFHGGHPLLFLGRYSVVEVI
jgi:hypothetical protein